VKRILVAISSLLLIIAIVFYLIGRWEDNYNARMIARILVIISYIPSIANASIDKHKISN
jgi:multisubunit Na+/H+ antiporter MnhF subunit